MVSSSRKILCLSALALAALGAFLLQGEAGPTPHARGEVGSGTDSESGHRSAPLARGGGAADSSASALRAADEPRSVTLARARVEALLANPEVAMGRVVNHAGTPLAGARVLLWRLPPPGTRGDAQLLEAFASDAAGHYRSQTALEAGDYYGLEASASGWQSARLGPFEPSGDAGSPRDLIMVPATQAVLAGRCVDASDRPVAHARVGLHAVGVATLRWPKDPERNEVLTNAEGRFEVPLPGPWGAEHELDIQAIGFLPAVQRVPPMSAPPADDASMVVRLEPARTLRGVVTTESGAPLAGLAIDVIDPSAPDARPVSAGGTDAGGGFTATISAAKPSIVRVLDASERVRAARAVQPDEPEPLTIAIDVHGATSLDRFEILVTDASGAPVSDYEVAWIRTDAPMAALGPRKGLGVLRPVQASQRVRSAIDGRAAIAAPLPGSYRLRVRAEAHGVGRSGPIEVDGHVPLVGRETVRLERVPGLEGRIEIQGGRTPLVDAEVILQERSADRAPQSGAARTPDFAEPGATGLRYQAKTAADGSFFIPALPSGVYALEVRHDAVVPSEAIEPIVVTDGPDRPLVVRSVVVGGRILGRVVDAAGRPDAGAVVAASPDKDPTAVRHAATDEDGRFALLGLATDRWTVRIVQHRHQVTGSASATGSSQSVQVTAGASANVELSPRGG